MMLHCNKHHHSQRSRSLDFATGEHALLRELMSVFEADDIVLGSAYP